MEDVYWWQYVVGILYIPMQATVIVLIAWAGAWTGWRVLRKNLSPQQREFKAPVWALITGLVFGVVWLVVVVTLPVLTFEEWRVPALGFLGITEDPYSAGLAGNALLALAVFTSGLAFACVSIWLYKLYFKFIRKNGDEQQGAPTPAQLEP